MSFSLHGKENAVKYLFLTSLFEFSNNMHVMFTLLTKFDDKAIKIE